jgi:hypothetical protein
MAEFLIVFAVTFAAVYAAGHVLAYAVWNAFLALCWLLSPSYRREQRESAERIKRYKAELAAHDAMMDYLNSLTKG